MVPPSFMFLKKEGHLRLAIFWTRSFSEVFGAYPEFLGVRVGPQTKINYTNWTV